MRQTLGWIGPWITLVSLSLWVASPSSLLLGFAALSIVLGFLGGVRERGVIWFIASIILVVGILTGTFADPRGVTYQQIGIHFGQQERRRLANNSEINFKLA